MTSFQSNESDEMVVPNMSPLLRSIWDCDVLQRDSSIWSPDETSCARRSRRFSSVTSMTDDEASSMFAEGYDSGAGHYDGVMEGAALPPPPLPPMTTTTKTAPLGCRPRTSRSSIDSSVPSSYWPFGNRFCETDSRRSSVAASLWDDTTTTAALVPVATTTTAFSGVDQQDECVLQHQTACLSDDRDHTDESLEQVTNNLALLLADSESDQSDVASWPPPTGSVNETLVAGQNRRSSVRVGSSVNARRSDLLLLARGAQASLNCDVGWTTGSPAPSRRTSFEERRALSMSFVESSGCRSSTTSTKVLLPSPSPAARTTTSTTSLKPTPTRSTMNAYEAALVAIEDEAKMRRTNAYRSKTTFMWQGVLRPKQHRGPTYARKVFVGGLPFDASSETLARSFASFAVRSVQFPPNGRGHAYVVFDGEDEVRSLLDTCDNPSPGKYYFWVTSYRSKARRAQIIPWVVEDSDWVAPAKLWLSVKSTNMKMPTADTNWDDSASRSATSSPSSSSSTASMESLQLEGYQNSTFSAAAGAGACARSARRSSAPATDIRRVLARKIGTSFDGGSVAGAAAATATATAANGGAAVDGARGIYKEKTIFVGALHGEITAEALQKIMSDLFGPVLHVGIDTDKYSYPNGSARVSFATVEAARQAVLAEFVHVVTPRFSKTIQLDVYIEDGLCHRCRRSTPVFCRHPTCLCYYCAACFEKHRSSSDDYHPPVMRNRTTASTTVITTGYNPRNGNSDSGSGGSLSSTIIDLLNFGQPLEAQSTAVAGGSEEDQEHGHWQPTGSGRRTQKRHPR